MHVGVSGRVVGVVEDDIITDAGEVSAKRLSEMFFGQYRSGRAEGYRGRVEEKDLVASAGVVEVVGGHYDSAS